MNLDLSLAALRGAYEAGSFTPAQPVDALIARRREFTAHNIWIHEIPDEDLRARASELAPKAPSPLPLYGVPFVIKDNIDLAGSPTTAACPDFAYVPAESAPVVQALLDAGA